MFTEERALWLYDHYLWLEKNLPKRDDRFTNVLIVPTKTFFPDKWTATHESALTVFDQVRNIMGMLEWPCVLTRKSGMPKKSEGLLGEFKSTVPRAHSKVGRVKW